MKYNNICILGGTGFVGQHIVARLASLGYQVLVPTRHPELHRELLVLPGVKLKCVNVHNQSELNSLFSSIDVVINLVGILNEKGNKGRGFQHAHVELTRKVLAACKQKGVYRLLHMSALNADINSLSHYLCSKGEAEELVHKVASDQLQVTSFRPSVIFGSGDGLFNRFSALLKLSPLVFPLACADSRLSPVYVGDVAEAFVLSLDDEETFGQRYDLCGPDRFSLRQLVEYTSLTLGLYHFIIGLNPFFSRLQARMLELMPGKPFSRDNYLSLQVDSICNDNGLEELGIHPTAVDTIVPAYLAQQSAKGRYQKYREVAGRVARISDLR